MSYPRRHRYTHTFHSHIGVPKFQAIVSERLAYQFQETDEGSRTDDASDDTIGLSQCQIKVARLVEGAIAIYCLCLALDNK
jgi:hypothetical protein